MPAHYRDDEWDFRMAQEDRMDREAARHFSPGVRAARVEEELREISLGLRSIRPNPMVPKGWEG